MTWTDTEHIVSDPVDGELMMRGAEIRGAIDAVLEIGGPAPIIVGASDGMMWVERDWCAGHVTVTIVACVGLVSMIALLGWVAWLGADLQRRIGNDGSVDAERGRES